MALPRVVILGGGMGGLATAWELSDSDWRTRYEGITVFQRGWRLGGKGASSRGVNARIEEHGLHVLLGYYHATFRLMDEVYAELDRPRRRPTAPITSWRDAVSPAPHVGLTDLTSGGWEPFVTSFTDVPGWPGDPPSELTFVEFVRRSLTLLTDFMRGEADRGDVFFSASPHPPSRDAGREQTLISSVFVAAAALLEQSLRFGDLGAPAGKRLNSALQPVRNAIDRTLAGGAATRRSWHLADLVLTNLRGMIVDELFVDEVGFAAINDLDYREWLRLHGAHESTLESPIVRGMYDLVFAYAGSDRTRPAFSAGIGLQLAIEMLFNYRGSIFWKLNAGMGEAVFAPLYEALVARGVRFEFFHTLEDVVPADAGGTIESIRLSRQVGLAPGSENYQPLVDVDGLPCWPAEPDHRQLEHPAGHLTETIWWDRSHATERVLHRGEDFDVAVLAVSLGMIPHTCRRLLDSDVRWQAMVNHVGSVPTRALQLWLEASESELGWHGPEGVTLSGFTEPFDTWSSMSHLLAMEQTPDARSIAYFCSVFEPLDGGEDDPAAADAATLDAARRFLDNEIGALWPNAVTPDGRFRWDLLAGADAADGTALESQFVRTNIDPSDRYVQSLPGTDSYRLAPGGSGFDNLVLAGDWTDCGLNAGCIEAAVRSGGLAARAVAERVRD